ncbi:hypothetical protein GPALN_010720 [Globodera pallida]|nr:hypothetical protein GPALN_010720 [Globodera pallida]
MSKFARLLCHTIFIFHFGTNFCTFNAPKNNGHLSRTNSDPSPLKDALSNANASNNSCGGQNKTDCHKENYFLFNVCNFLARRSTKLSSEWATGSPGPVLSNSNKMRWRCVHWLNGMLTGSTVFPQMDKWLQFRFAPEDGQRKVLLGAILIGGPLLTKLDIYDTKIDYDDNFFNIILQEVLYTEAIHSKMVDKLLIVTKRTKWPNLLTKFFDIEAIQKLSQSQEIAVKIGQHLRITVTVRVKMHQDGLRGYGVVCTVERHGTAVFKIGLFNDLNDLSGPAVPLHDDGQQRHIDQFVLFVVEKVGPGLVNNL